MSERTNHLTTSSPYKNLMKLRGFSCLSHAVIFITLLVVITGCSGPLKQASQFSKEIYRTEQINDLRNSRIGFLTTAVAQGNGLGEYKSILSDIIEKNFREEQPEINILTSRDILNRINSADLAGEYVGMIAGYNLTGILERKTLEKVGNVIEVKYIAQPRLSSFTERTSTRLIAFGLSLISTRETSVNISLQIWDTKTGSIVWEGSGQATIAVEAMRAKPVSFEDVAEVASRGLVKKFQP